MATAAIVAVTGLVLTSGVLQPKNEAATPGEVPRLAGLTPTERTGSLGETEPTRGAVQTIGAWRVVDQDIIVGPLQAGELDEYATLARARPWPCAVIPYRFAQAGQHAVSATTRETVKQAMRAWEAHTPIRFVEIKASETIDDWLEVRQWSYGWGISAVGYRGSLQTLYLPNDVSQRLATHELGHTIGLYHAHQHPAREGRLQVHYDCLDADHRRGFVARDASFYFGDYDVASVMHYRSTGFCRADVDDADGDGKREECGFYWEDGQQKRCLVLERTTGQCPDDVCLDRDGDTKREFIDGSMLPSVGDVESVRALYATAAAHTDRGVPGLGAALTQADFAGDTKPELVAIASQRTGASAYVYRWLANRAHLCHVVDLQLNANNSPERPLATATAFDIDDNGREEVVVAIQGQVVVLEGSSKTDDIHARIVYRHDAPDRDFGRSIARFEFSEQHEGFEVLIGDPHGSFAGQANVGQVIVLADVMRNPHELTRFGGGQPLPIVGHLGQTRILAWTRNRLAKNERFGAALAVGDFLPSPGDELAVSSPCKPHHRATCAGVVTVFRQREGQVITERQLALAGTAQDVSGASFGTALAVMANADGETASLMVDAPYSRGTETSNQSEQAALTPVVSAYSWSDDRPRHVRWSLPAALSSEPSGERRQLAVARFSNNHDLADPWMALADPGIGAVAVGHAGFRRSIQLGGSSWAKSVSFGASLVWLPPTSASPTNAATATLVVGLPDAPSGGQINLYRQDAAKKWQMQAVLGGPVH